MAVKPTSAQAHPPPDLSGEKLPATLSELPGDARRFAKASTDMIKRKPPDSEALTESIKKTETLEQQARDLAHSVEAARQHTLAEANERIEALEQKARDLASFVETTRLLILSQSDKKIAALEQKARDLADFVETLRHQTRLQSEKKIEALGKKAGDLAHFVEAVRKETQLEFETKIAAMAQRARDLAVSVEAMREMTLLQSDSEIAMLGQTQIKTVAMNEALVIGALRQHELTENAENLNDQLQAEITGHKRTEAALRAIRARLAHHAGQLERMVARRTAQLTATNKRLEAAVHSTRKGRAEYRKLLLESQQMQKKLRHLTRQIITAQEEERKEISRELHDEVVQTLVGINVGLSALGRGAGAGPALKQQIAHTQRLVENSVNAVHRFARELRPAVLDDLGLIPALHAYSKNLVERKKFKIHLTAFGGVEALDSAKRIVLFRVAQEALTNVVRHAHATQVKINISQIPGAVRMEIDDNGRSFHVEKTLRAKNPKRLGLIGMQERIEMVGGKLAVVSTPGRGTMVRADIPFLAGNTAS